MINNFEGFLPGILIGAVLTMGGLSLIGIVPEYHAAKDLCEESLPRDQQCEMHFKPIEDMEAG